MNGETVIERDLTGVCAKHVLIHVLDNKVTFASIKGGCPGGMRAICNFMTGMELKDIIQRMEDIGCGARSTSCPAQIARLLKGYLENDIDKYMEKNIVNITINRR